MKGMKHLLTVTSSIAALCLSASAFAGMSAPYGWYLEGNVGYSHLSNRTYSGDASWPGVGLNANLGYKFMPYIGTEIGYSQYAPTIIRANGVKGGTERLSSYDLALRGILPIGGSGVELFGKLGVGRFSAATTTNNAAAASSLHLHNTKRNATGVYAGAGIQYYFMPELAINTQWQHMQGNSSTGNMDMVSAGFSFIFD